MKKWIIAFSALAASLLLLLPSGVTAKSYSLAGCGPGSVIMGSKPGIMQTSAATTNGTGAQMGYASINFQFTAILLGTSNCNSNGVIKAELEQKAYVAYNMENLQKDIAKGNGESVNSLAYLMGCSIESMPEFAEVTKENHNVIFEGEKGSESDWVLYRIKTVVSENETLNKSCTKVWM